MKRPVKQVTQSQIARAAKVSQATVSAILSGSDSLNVSMETRRTIFEVAERLGYVARKSVARKKTAKAGASSRKQNVLIVESSSRNAAVNEPWIKGTYQALMGKIADASGQCLREHGIGVSIFYLDEPQELIQWLAESDVCGVLWHANDSDSSLLHWVASRFPLVLLNREWGAHAPFDSVSVDQEKNILIAADYLWTQGHRRIATFGHNPTVSFFRRRINTYREFVASHNARDYREFQEISDALDVSAATKVDAIVETWKSLGEDAPSALITSDVFALTLLQKARKAGIRIPEDLSVVGIDNTTACDLVEPALTSMEEPFEEMCKVAVDLLLRRMETRDIPAYTVHIAPTLVERESVLDYKQSNNISKLATR